MVKYEAIFAVREEFYSHTVAAETGMVEVYCPGYRIRRDRFEAENKNKAWEMARQIKQNITDCFTVVQILSLSDKIGLSVPKYLSF